MDGIQIYIYFSSQSQRGLYLGKFKLELCVKHIYSWMVSNRLKLNQDETELLPISSRHSQYPVLRCLQVGNEKTCLSESTRNLRVYFDQHARCSVHMHVKKRLLSSLILPSKERK